MEELFEVPLSFLGDIYDSNTEYFYLAFEINKFKFNV